jgi:hypothetical protein
MRRAPWHDGRARAGCRVALLLQGYLAHKQPQPPGILP